MNTERNPAVAKFEARALAVVQSESRLKNATVRIVEDKLIVEFDCPCGDRLIEMLELSNLWKSRFDQYLAGLTKGIIYHLQEEGFL